MAEFVALDDQLSALVEKKSFLSFLHVLDLLKPQYLMIALLFFNCNVIMACNLKICAVKKTKQNITNIGLGLV